MPSRSKSAVTATLMKLAEEVKLRVEAAKGAKGFAPPKFRFRRWKVLKEKHDHRGYVVTSAQAKDSIEPDWDGSVFAIAEEICKGSAYKAAAKRFTTRVFMRRNIIDVLVDRLAKCYFRYSSRTAIRVKKLIDDFQDNFREPPYTISTEVELRGVAVVTTPLRFQAEDNSITLRSIVRSDIEKPFRILDAPIDHSPTNRGTAILRIAHPAMDLNNPRSYQRRIDAAVGILHLCGVAAVHYHSYEMWMGGRNFRVPVFGRVEAPASGGRYVFAVNQKNRRHVAALWRALQSVLPDEFFEDRPTHGDYRHIAYSRYKSATLDNVDIEQRIANSVMGLEALLGGNQPELKFRLTMHAGQMLRALGHDGLKVAALLRDAYDVRSAYVHGDKITPKNRRKCGRSYGSVDALGETAVNYLRVLLIAVLLFGARKKDLLARLEDALISESHWRDLRRDMARIRSLPLLTP